MAETTAKEKDKTEESALRVPESKAPPEKKTSRLPKTLVVIVAMQIALAAGAYCFVRFILAPKVSSSESFETGAQGARAVGRETGEIHLIDNIIVNPAETNGTRYLSTSIGLELPRSEKIAEHMKELTPEIRDILIAIISSKTLDELSSAAGKEAMRKEILEKVNRATLSDTVFRVFYIDYVLQ